MDLKEVLIDLLKKRDRRRISLKELVIYLLALFLLIRDTLLALMKIL